MVYNSSDAFNRTETLPDEDEGMDEYENEDTATRQRQQGQQFLSLAITERQQSMRVAQEESSDRNTAGASTDQGERINQRRRAHRKNRGKYRKYDARQIELLLSAHYDQGLTINACGERLGMPSSTSRYYIKQYFDSTEGAPAPKKRGRIAAPKLSNAHTAFLIDFCDQNPTAALEEIQEELQNNMGLTVSVG
ncbi:hypothetical protein VTP01DRAFT_5018 [Rhizomucor pusillus]|uniref:uncharacterized protein n=1 Tax=Rhizomucor pusillus TaxID=4840 RepID=UPI00374244C8